MRYRNPRLDPGCQFHQPTRQLKLQAALRYCTGGLAAGLLLASSQVAAQSANDTTVDKQIRLASLSQAPQTDNGNQQNVYRSPWVTTAGLKDNAQYMLGTIANAESFGVDPDRLHASELGDILGVHPQRLGTAFAESQYRPAELLKVDQLLTSAFKLLVGEVMNGRVTPKESQRSWYVEHNTINADDWWQMLQLQPGSLQQILSDLAAKNRKIETLVVEMQRLQQIDEAGGWPMIPDGPTIESGHDSMRVSVMRSRLALSGDYDPALDNGSADVYSLPLEQSVIRFQARHGLTTDGIVGPGTLAALNTSVKQRIEQIQVNIERNRWLPDNMGDRYIVTNIPDYRLQVVNHGVKTLEMPVVVGKPKHATPAFSAEMNHLVVNPTWTVPRSIANKELVPSERANPGYLQRKGYNVLASDGSRISYDSLSPDVWNQSKFPYTLRQRPGKRNALGKVKFMFPNRHSIYLHDTPAKKLFAKNKRAFSHGCVRVGEPRELANHLLEQEGWNPGEIDALFARTKTKRVEFSQPLQNYIVYITSWVDDNGVLQFRNDVYGHDKRVATALAAESDQRVALMNEFRSLQPVVFAEQLQ